MRPKYSFLADPNSGDFKGKMEINTVLLHIENDKMKRVLALQIRSILSRYIDIIRQKEGLEELLLNTLNNL